MKDPIELPFFFRQFLSWALQSAGVERLPEREGAWPDYFDNTESIGPVKRPAFYKGLTYKGRPGKVEPEKKIGVECHITAVAFGTTARRRSFWKKQIASWQEHPDTIIKYAGGQFAPEAGNDAGVAAGIVLADPATVEAISIRMALHERFWKVPYHFVALLNGDILYNNSIDRYTYHGNGGNGPMIGCSSEANLPGLEKSRKKKHHDIDDFFIKTSRANIRLAVGKGREVGSDIGLMTAHRQYSKGRLGDPGEGWWKEIGKPMAKELDLEIKYDFRHGSGNYLCREWDDDALYDYKGRPIRDPSVSPNSD